MSVESARAAIGEALQQILTEHEVLDVAGAILTDWVIVGGTDSIEPDNTRIFKLAATNTSSVTELGMLEYGKLMLMEDRFDFSGDSDD